MADMGPDGESASHIVEESPPISTLRSICAANGGNLDDFAPGSGGFLTKIGAGLTRELRHLSVLG
jgi:hypothetical protein